MRYPIVIEIGNDQAAFGAAVPDLPGCFAAGDTLDEVIKDAESAAYAWIEWAIDAGHDIPKPSTLEAVRAIPDYAGWTLGVVEIDPAAIDPTPERVNIILPKRVLKLLDAKAKAHGESRSGYIAHLALAAE